MLHTNLYIEHCLEGASSILSDLPQKEKETLARNHTHTVLKKGDFIFREGDKASGVYCLAAGKVKVFKEGIGGRDQIIRMVKPYALLGYNALLTGAAYYASSVAVEESAICFFDKSTFLGLLRENSEFAIKMMRMMAGDMTFVNERTISLTQKHIRGRLAESLLFLKDTFGYENDGKTIKVCLSREDLASLSNMTTSNAIRTLSVFATENVIALEGKKIKILDTPKLEWISHLG